MADGVGDVLYHTQKRIGTGRYRVLQKSNLDYTQEEIMETVRLFSPLDVSCDTFCALISLHFNSLSTLHLACSAFDQSLVPTLSHLNRCGLRVERSVVHVHANLQACVCIL